MSSSIQLAGALLILGRILLGGLFVAAGIRHFFLLPVLGDVMAKRGVPAAKWAVIAGSVFQIIAGAMFMQGAERENAKNFLLSNMAVTGGLLIAAAQAL